jgi:multicomponent Na+:H+ antiporter subunit B
VSGRARHVVVLVALAALAVPLAWALGGLEPFGHYAGPYGLAIERAAPGERHVTALVSAVVFDYRGLDTLGEEFILFAAAVGCSLLLRSRRAERGESGDERERPAPPEPAAAGRALGGTLVGPLIVLGLYLMTHGQISPGGGFQAGLILVGALLLAYAAGQRLALGRVRAERLLELAESAGAGGFAVLAALGLVVAGATLQNFIALGTSGDILSGGTIPLGNLIVGLEVTGAVALVLSEFLDQALLGRGDGP